MRLPVFLFVLTLGVPLSAITVKPISFVELVGDSTAVVYGRVADVRGQWSADRQGIDSLLRLDAVEYFKGQLGDSVTLRVPGGRVGTFVNVLPGVPTFSEGDLVVFFLKTDGPAIPIVTGTTQGVFRVTRDPRTGTALVMPPAIGPHDGRIVRGDPARVPLPLRAFGEAIRRAGAGR